MRSMLTALCVVAFASPAFAQAVPLRPTRPVHLIAIIDIAPSRKDEGRTLLMAYAAHEKTAVGCKQFELLQQGPPSDNHFAFVETWTGIDAEHANEETRETKAFRAAILPLSGSPFDERLYFDPD